MNQNDRDLFIRVLTVSQDLQIIIDFITDTEGITPDLVNSLQETALMLYQSTVRYNLNKKEEG